MSIRKPVVDSQNSIEMLSHLKRVCSWYSICCPVLKPNQNKFKNMFSVTSSIEKKINAKDLMSKWAMLEATLQIKWRQCEKMWPKVKQRNANENIPQNDTYRCESTTWKIWTERINQSVRVQEERNTNETKSQENNITTNEKNKNKTVDSSPTVF